jgi:transcription elongation GreA/GreB family factor
MLQLEQEKVRNQLSEAQHQLALLNKLQPTAVHTTVAPGSLVKTDRGYLYVSIAAGKALVNDQAVIALSPQSPLGQQLLKLRAGQTATVNQTSYYIESVE